MTDPNDARVFYHILARGNNKQVIFKDDQDYNEVLKV